MDRLGPDGADSIAEPDNGRASQDREQLFAVGIALGLAIGFVVGSLVALLLGEAVVTALWRLVRGSGRRPDGKNLDLLLP